MITEKNKDIIHTATADVWLDKEGIVWIVNQVVEINMDGIKENTEAVRQVSQGVRRPVINEAQSIRMVDKEGRDYGASQEVAEVVKAMALVSNSKVGVMVLNFFIRLSRPPYPTKLFSDTESALIWLRTFLD